MTENEKVLEEPRTMYQIGREFYERKVTADLVSVLEAKKAGNSYKVLELTEDIELSLLKLSQLGRREELFSNGKTK